LTIIIDCEQLYSWQQKVGSANMLKKRKNSAKTDLHVCMGRGFVCHKSNI